VWNEYKDNNFKGRTYCEEKTIELYFNKRDHRFSSSGLRREVYLKEIDKGEVVIKK
jgi:glycerol-3-phosphate cytidylyltransferase